MRLPQAQALGRAKAGPLRAGLSEPVEEYFAAGRQNYIINGVSGEWPGNLWRRGGAQTLHPSRQVGLTSQSSSSESEWLFPLIINKFREYFSDKAGEGYHAPSREGLCSLGEQ